MYSRTRIYALFDILSVTLIFSVFLLMRAEPFIMALNRYLYSFLLFLGIWLIISFLSKKYSIHQETRMVAIFRNILLANLIVLGIATTLMYLVRVVYYSRTIVFGTIITATVLEVIWAFLEFYLRTAIIEPPEVASHALQRRRAFLKRSILMRH